MALRQIGVESSWWEELGEVLTLRCIVRRASTPLTGEGSGDVTGGEASARVIREINSSITAGQGNPLSPRQALDGSGKTTWLTEAQSSKHT